MKRLEELILAWEEQRLAPEGYEELKALLQNPANRAELVEYFHTSEMITSFFSEQQNEVCEKGSEAKPLRVIPTKSPSKQIPSKDQQASVIRFPRMLALAASVLVIIGTWVGIRQILSSPVLAVLDQVQGDVYILNSGERSLASIGEELANGVRVIARGDESRARLIYPDRSRVSISAGTEISIWESKNEKKVNLGQGMLVADLKKQKVDRPFIFDTVNARAVVIGTQLTLRVQEKSSRLEVLQGHVQFVRKKDNRSVMVKGGYHASVEPDTLFSAKPNKVLSPQTGKTPTGIKGTLEFKSTEQKESGEIEYTE